MLLPVGTCQIGIADRVASMEHTVIPLIYTDVRNVSTSVIGRVEKDQIPSLCFGQGDVLRHVVLLSLIHIFFKEQLTCQPVKNTVDSIL